MRNEVYGSRESPIPLKGRTMFTGVEGFDEWEWDGSMEAPTLHPSIDDRSEGGWHGWLKGGRLE